jgi:hypothetical protein
MKKIFINADRSGYAPDQIKRTMTVAELRAMLDNYDDDAKVYLKHDRGYTYGGISEWMFEETEPEEDCDACGYTLENGDCVNPHCMYNEEVEDE